MILNRTLRRSNGSKGIAFYIEALLLILFLLGCIVVLVQLFASSRSMGQQAESLTVAVNLAKNTAEDFIASSSDEDFAVLVSNNNEVKKTPITVWYDADGSIAEEDKGSYRLIADITTHDEMRSLQVTVQDKSGEMIYSLSTKTLKD